MAVAGTGPGPVGQGLLCPRDLRMRFHQVLFWRNGSCGQQGQEMAQVSTPCLCVISLQPLPQMPPQPWTVVVPKSHDEDTLLDSVGPSGTESPVKMQMPVGTVPPRIHLSRHVTSLPLFSSQLSQRAAW